LLAYSISGGQVNETNPGQDRVLYLKYWHIVIMLVVQILVLGIAYGKLTQQIEDLAGRVTTMENTKFVTRDEYDSFKTDLRDTLNRIETEIVERNKVENGLR
jgi:hypothetical protein